MNRLQEQHENLREAVRDPEVCLQYLPGTRAYGIFMLESTVLDARRVNPTNKEFYSVRTWHIDYCPWTGDLLPGYLGYARNRVLKKEFGLPPVHIFDNPYAPKGFYEDESWWVDRRIDVKRRPRQGPRSWKPGSYRSWIHEPAPNIVSHALRRFLETPPHLCRTLASVCDDVRCMITYIPWTREYGIRRVAVDRLIDYQPIRMMKIDYCPWCATKLPGSLKQEWLSQIAADGHDLNDPDLPAKYLSDTWWKEAGL